MKWKIETSWRYGVVGVYRDRSFNIWHVYVPFVRLSVGDLDGYDIRDL